MVCGCANTVKKPLLQVRKEMNFATKDARTSITYTNQEKEKKETEEIIENRNINIGMMFILHSRSMRRMCLSDTISSMLDF